MRICVYEDRHVRGLEPLTLTRPVIDLLCGLTNLGEKQARYFAATAVGHLCRPLVADQIRTRDSLARVNDPAWLRAAPTVLVNARWVPPPHPRSGGLMLHRRGVGFGASNLFADGSYLGTVEGEIGFAVLDTGLLSAVSPATLDDCLTDWVQSLPTREVGGTLVSRPWELIDLNPNQIVRDFDAVADRGVAGFHPTGFAIVGPADRLVIHPSAKIDPMVVADTTHGPVVIGAGAVVHAFTRLEGPCAIGEGTVLLGATVRAGTTFGPRCRIGGEVECSIVMGYTNKYHDGFLGHSYLGEWVNLAAGTSTSDLRCDYRTVSIPVDGHELQTGLTKVGAMIGDHAKTGLGVLLDCGTTIGPFAQALPSGGFAPRTIPGFTRAGAFGLKELTDVDRLLATADVVMRRRGKELSPVLDAVYRTIAAQRPVSPEVLPLRRSA
jgi:UDP-N-acetylglucosamine diphosphorylase / glucose-1-phosphate thymidylyltransferase / UDP-N-acetylgalactosamine diphosphorylase / glucosamine-1-phosphate N-acetyltransferase / galactosamine-1-phosphate N-acetyltransferase